MMISRTITGKKSKKNFLERAEEKMIKSLGSGGREQCHIMSERLK